MSWDDSEEDQRWHNLMIFNFWGTDRELEEAGPILGVVLLLILLVAGGFVCFNKPPEKPEVVIENSKPADKIIVGDSI